MRADQALGRKISGSAPAKRWGVEQDMAGVAVFLVAVLAMTQIVRNEPDHLQFVQTMATLFLPTLNADLIDRRHAPSGDARGSGGGSPLQVRTA